MMTLSKFDTFLKDVPTAKIEFDYEIYNEKNELLTKAYTSLVFISKETMKPIAAPEDIIEKIKAAVKAKGQRK